MVCELPQKLDLLWAFIKQHLRNRTLIFVSTCKQVLVHASDEYTLAAGQAHHSESPLCDGTAVQVDSMRPAAGFAPEC